MKTIQAIRGMNDLLPEPLRLWQFVEACLINAAEAYGYSEIRFPIVESTTLFKRSIGDVTDIVEKEMYTFADRNGDSLTLRPEGTASCVRAALNNGLLQTPGQRLWYLGPMFRHERPQKGRYRQFTQFGIECFGIDSPELDAELIAMTARFWQHLGLAHSVELQINSLGSNQARAHYREQLTQYFNDHYAQLDEDSQRRLSSNPLRILDSKNPDLRDVIAGAPSLLDHLDAESAEHFQRLQQLLTELNIPFQVNPTLVRGLDYYNRTVFEWVTTELGAQGTVCAGGRYDGLVEQLGGKATPAAGFALGMERLVSLCEARAAEELPTPVDVYLIRVGENVDVAAMQLAEALRDELPLLRIISHCGEGSFKSQFKRADRSGAELALILGEEEVAANTLSIKFLREQREQEVVSQSELANLLREYFHWS